MERKRLILERSTEPQSGDIHFYSSIGNPSVRGGADNMHYVCWNCEGVIFEVTPTVNVLVGRRRVVTCMKCGGHNRFPKP